LQFHQDHLVEQAEKIMLSGYKVLFLFCTHAPKFYLQADNIFAAGISSRQQGIILKELQSK
jgi:hypothetical protein